ncbi:MAG: septum formation inhibitor Maf [Oleiphilaceae bacterium]|nr:septum formation inhibitor Maf [Oleiphilaceae bacterium]
MRPIVLASASPRRAELLAQLGLQSGRHFSLGPVAIDETPQTDEPPARYVTRLAREKAMAGLARTTDAGALVIGSDTSVICDDEILGKPRDRAEAEAMLARLSGRSHTVMTAVAIAASEQGCVERLVTTEVDFRPLTAREISAYCATGEPMDKAGAYGIQGRGGAFVTALRGSYSAVVGLPLEQTASLLAEAGQPVWQFWAAARTGQL